MKRLVLLGLLLHACPALSQPLEPPPEAPEGADYVMEPADSVAEGDVEVGMGAAGRAGGGATRSRRMRFSGGDLSGAVHEGRGDPLSGGMLEARGRLGEATLGRLAPRWGRGLVLGAAGEPWERDALDRGARAAFRGRAGDGVMLRRGSRTQTEGLVGRFGGRVIGGARVRNGGVSLGAITDGHGAREFTISFQRGAGESELAWDGAGRWRAEAVLERPITAGDDRRSDAWRVTGRARAGATGFASLAESGRRGPAQALAAGVSGAAAGTRVNAFGALWRFRPGVAGSRAGLAIERSLAHHGVLTAGIEEQRGWRRDAGTTAARAASAGLRQGLWGEWWSGPGALGLGVRHEFWGERPWARRLVRSVTGARIEGRAWGNIQWGVIHTLFRVNRGESLYLREVESDRMVLRALSGEGERTSIEARGPLAGGRMRAALHLASTAERRARTQWTLDWTRRARIRGSAETRHSLKTRRKQSWPTRSG